MIVGGYLLHLYCAARCERERARETERVVGGCGPATGEFGGESSREARATARSVGWIFSRGEAWCSRACLTSSQNPSPEAP